MNKSSEMLPMVGEGGGCGCGCGDQDEPTQRKLIPPAEENRPSTTDLPYVVGELQTVAGPVPRVTSDLTFRDTLGGWKARWGIGRMEYKANPILFAIGTPSTQSPVLVTANYKMSFDRLRGALSARDAWILVLDTNGVNVWCAAGKRTFGTEELVRRIEAAGLKDVVEHRELILPQLGAPGVAAHEIKRRTGFKVIYGPILAADLPEFLDNNRNASPRMRSKKFPLGERLALIPMELVPASKSVALIALAFASLSGLGASEGYWSGVAHAGGFAVGALAAAMIAGTVLFPVLLPYLPGRAFSLKALPLSLLTAGGVSALAGPWRGWSGGLEIGAWFLLIPALATYLAMNFTGSTTYTSLSGVRKEMRIAVPLQIMGASLGIVLWLSARWIG